MARIDWEPKPIPMAVDQRHTVVVPCIRAVLVDDAGEGIAGQTCVVIGPDKFRVALTTDRQGKVRVPVPPGGGYEISYTELDESAWGPEPDGARE
jgi:hypothetical protein